MRDGDVESSGAVTHTRIAEPQDDGTTIIKTILESLDSSPPISRQQMDIELQPVNNDFHDEQMQNMTPPQSPRPRKCRVSITFLWNKKVNQIVLDATGLHIGVRCSHRWSSGCIPEPRSTSRR
jgi:hypothetical protein